MNCVPWMIFWACAAALFHSHSVSLRPPHHEMTGFNVKSVDCVAAGCTFLASICMLVFPEETLRAYYPSKYPSSVQSVPAGCATVTFVTGCSLFMLSGLLCTTVAKHSTNSVKAMFFGMVAASAVLNNETQSMYPQLTLFVSVVLTAFYLYPEAF